MRFLIMVVFLLAMTSTAEAKQPKESRVKFYNFDELLVDGEVKKPRGLLIEDRRAAEFGRLFKLKKSFLPSLMETARDKAFR